MKEDKSLVITYYKDAYFFPYVENENIAICELLAKRSKLFKVLSHFPILSILTYGFKGELRDSDRVIIFDQAYNIWLGLYLRLKKKKNVSLYFWNPISKMYPHYGKKMVDYAKKLMPVYSFDHNDCQEYGIEYRPMVYSGDVKMALQEKSEPEYDIFFLGWKKDRSKQIERLYYDVFKSNFKCLFILVGDEDRAIDDSIIYTTQKVPYSEYLEYVQNSRAILDIPQEGQEGLTIRNVECLFLQKKMVTTNSNIKNYDLYNDNNVYILSSRNDEESLNHFIHSEFIKVCDKVLSKYDFVNWVNTF